MKIYAINIETLELEKEENWSKGILLVDSIRRKRVGELKQKKDRMQSMAAGLLLRYSFLQAGYENAQWEQIEMAHRQNGKPYLIQYPEFCYSLSHSGKWVICAVHSKELGADIQEMRPWNERVAKRFFSTQEYERIVNAKEGYGKLTGDGIGKGISQYLTSQNFDRVVDTWLQREARLKVYEQIEEYMICVCMREEESFPDKPEIVNNIF